jgi:predicted ArsR family transcriptional regulator
MFNDLLQSVDSLRYFQGITPSDLIAMPNPLRATLRKMLRHKPMPSNEMAIELGISEDEAQQLGMRLVDKGVIQVVSCEIGGHSAYELCLARTQGRASSTYLNRLFDN